MKDVEIKEDALSVTLMDGRSVLLVWYLAGGGYGIHWPDVDEDLSTEGLLRGAPATRQPLSKA